MLPSSAGFFKSSALAPYPGGISNVPISPRATAIEILCFIDRVDCYFWRKCGDEDAVIQAIEECFSDPLAKEWLNRLIDAKKPRKMSLNDFNAGLLKEFGIRGWEGPMWERYGPEASEGEGKYGVESKYFNSHQFFLKLSYIDEIEKYKDQMIFSNLRQLDAKQRTDEYLDKHVIHLAWVLGKKSSDERNLILKRENSKLRSRLDQKPARTRVEAFAKYNAACAQAKVVLQSELSAIEEASDSSKPIGPTMPLPSTRSGFGPVSSSSVNRIVKHSPSQSLPTFQEGNENSQPNAVYRNNRKQSRRPLWSNGFRFPSFSSEEGSDGERGKVVAEPSDASIRS